MSFGDVILLVMAVILPPLPVAIKSGVCSGAFFLNILLFILAYIPGVIHAWYIILKHPENQQHIVHRHLIVAGQHDLERNPVSGTYPGQVYQQQPNITAGPSQGAGGGNMDGVYGNLPGHQGKASKTGNYGTIDPTSAQNLPPPPAYE